MKQDRNIVFEDEKQRVLDFTEYKFIPPEAGIYEGELRYYAASLEWSRFLEGHIAWLASIAAWPEAEDERYHAIQQILIFLRGVEPDMATQEDIAKGMYQAFNWLALQVATGQYANINLSTDEDGVVTPVTDAETETPIEDDPATTIDETAAARAGGCKLVTDGMQEVLTRLFTWKGTGTITDQQAADRLVLLYNFDAAKAAILTNYWWTVYNNSSGDVTLNQPIVDSFFYCKGVSINSFAEYVYEQHATAAEIPVLEVFMENFPVEQMTLWYNRGTATPSTDYIPYSCTKNPPESWTLNFALAESFVLPISYTLKAGHRYMIEAVGSFVDADVPNNIQDFFWRRDTSTGVLTFTGFSLNVSGTTNAVANQVPYQSSHAYAWTFDKAGDDGGNITKTNDTYTNPNVTGTIIVTLTDLGEFAL